MKCPSPQPPTPVSTCQHLGIDIRAPVKGRGVGRAGRGVQGVHQVLSRANAETTPQRKLAAATIRKN